MNSIMNLSQKSKVDEKDIVLRVPRRPKWTPKMSAEELHDLENVKFFKVYKRKNTKFFLYYRKVF